VNETVRSAVNKIAALAGLRVVNRTWGPRGEWASLQKARNAGVCVKQVVDVGASNGIWTRQALRIFPDAKYFLFDALESNRSALEKLKREQPACDYWIGALGPETGTQQFFSTGDQSSFFKSETFPSNETLQLDIRRLDAFVESGAMQLPELIKADIQGFELEMLKGAARCLEHAELVLLEVSFHQVYARAPLAHDVVAWMGERGFRLYDICTYSQRISDKQLTQSDFLFAPKRSILFKNEGGL
jgi:FkbM family methyltransferase